MNWKYTNLHKNRRQGSVYLMALLIFALLSITLAGILQTVNQRSQIATNEMDHIQARYTAESLINQIIFDPNKIADLSAIYKDKILGQNLDHIPLETKDLVLLKDESITRATLRRSLDCDFEYVLRLQTGSQLLEVCIPFRYPSEENLTKDLVYYWQAVDQWIKSNDARVYNQKQIRIFARNAIPMISFSDEGILTTQAVYQSPLLMMQGLDDQSLDETIEDAMNSLELPMDVPSEDLADTEANIIWETETDQQTQTESESVSEIDRQPDPEIESESERETPTQILEEPMKPIEAEVLSETLMTEALQEPFVIDSGYSLLLEDPLDLEGVLRLSGQVQVRGIVTIRGLVLLKDVHWVFEPGAVLHIGGLLVSEETCPANIRYRPIPQYSDPYLESSSTNPSSLPQAGRATIREAL